jgi:hypothetical protein
VRWWTSCGVKYVKDADCVEPRIAIKCTKYKQGGPDGAPAARPPALLRRRRNSDLCSDAFAFRYLRFGKCSREKVVLNAGRQKWSLLNSAPLITPRLCTKIVNLQFDPADVDNMIDGIRLLSAGNRRTTDTRSTGHSATFYDLMRISPFRQGRDPHQPLPCRVRSPSVSGTPAHAAQEHPLTHHKLRLAARVSSSSSWLANRHRYYTGAGLELPAVASSGTRSHRLFVRGSSHSKAHSKPSLSNAWIR